MTNWRPGEPDDFAMLLDTVPIAVTILDAAGNIVWFNDYATKILDRKPEYIGRDLRGFHNPKSMKKIGEILEAYNSGVDQEFAWQLKPKDKVFAVRVAPLAIEGGGIGLVHTVMVLD